MQLPYLQWRTWPIPLWFSRRNDKSEEEILAGILCIGENLPSSKLKSKVPLTGGEAFDSLSTFIY